MLALLVASPAAVLSQGHPMGGCSPQKACDFLNRMHEQCISVDPWPPHPIPGAPGCESLELLCTPDESCVLDGAELQDNITTNGLNRNVTMANVVIQNAPFTENYPADPEALLGMGAWGRFVGTNITFQNGPRWTTATKAGAGCVHNNAGYFACTDCVFRNCSNIGTGGGVFVGPQGTQLLVRPVFEECFAGQIKWSGTHKPAFGDGCYCEKPDATDCVGCACEKGEAGGEPGWYCDSKNSGSACASELTLFCDAAKRASAGDCSVCCGQHQQQLQSAGCSDADFTSFCAAPPRPTHTMVPWLAAAATAAAASSPPTGAHSFDAVWNCPYMGNILASNPFGIAANPSAAFNGSVVTLFYGPKTWPSLHATTPPDVIPCWRKQAGKPCTWDQSKIWTNITVTSNGGVPQAGDIELHKQAVADMVIASIPDPDFSGYGTGLQNLGVENGFESERGVWFSWKRYGICIPHFNRTSEPILFRGRKTILQAPNCWSPGTGSSTGSHGARSTARMTTGSRTPTTTLRCWSRRRTPTGPTPRRSTRRPSASTTPAASFSSRRR